MASNKFVIKCGNFAVLVDVHILPQGSSKDTSWFSDHEKEEVCMLLEEVVASRVKHYLEAPKQRGQWKSMEHATSGPLFLTEKIKMGSIFRDLILPASNLHGQNPARRALISQGPCSLIGTEPYPHILDGTDISPLFVVATGLRSEYVAANSFHITAYFMKRWVNLRCAVGKHYHELRVFPDRFIVCVSKLESNPSAWTCESGVLKEELSNGTSEYFTESAENKKPKISRNEQIKQNILKEIVKRTKTRRRSTSKLQIRKDSKEVYLGSVDSQTGNRKNDCQTSLSPPSEVKCRSRGLLKDCINTAESNLELPVLELENYVNPRQPDDVSSQQKPHSVEWLNLSLLSKNSPCSSESALLGPKQSQRVTKTQAQQKSCGAGEKLEHLKKVSSEGTPLFPSNTEMSMHDGDCLGLFLEEKTPLNSMLFSKQDTTKTSSDEESLTLGKKLSQPLSVRNNIVQTSQNEPSTTTEELFVKPSSRLELQPVSSEKLIQKRKKEVENGLRKLKLQRLKKS